MAVNNENVETSLLAPVRKKDATGLGRGSTASSTNSYERRGPVVKSQITVYYFGRFDCAPFNTRKLLAPA